MNELFPIFLKAGQLHLLIAGGGYVGYEKLLAVINNSPEAQVTLVSPIISDEIRAFSKAYKKILLVEDRFHEAHLSGKDLVIAATNDPAVNEEIYILARRHKILCNVADTPALCDFYLSSVVQKGNLKIGISTNGKSPTIAKRLKEVLQESLPGELDDLLDHMQTIRKGLTDDFTGKVKKLNTLTAGLVDPSGLPLISIVYHEADLQKAMKVAEMVLCAINRNEADLHFRSTTNAGTIRILAGETDLLEGKEPDAQSITEAFRALTAGK